MPRFLDRALSALPASTPDPQGPLPRRYAERTPPPAGGELRVHDGVAGAETHRALGPIGRGGPGRSSHGEATSPRPSCRRAPAPRWSAVWPGLFLLAACGGSDAAPAPSRADRAGEPEAAVATLPIRFRPDETRLAKGVVELPVRWGLGPLLTASIDGSEPETFLLDTGFGVCALDERFAANLPGEVVAIHGEGAIVGAAGEAVDLERGKRIASMRIGALELRGIDAVVVDLSAISGAHGVQLAGVIGFPAFADCLLTLDPARRRVAVSGGELGEPDGGEVLPMEVDAIPAITARLDEREIRLEIQSGSNEGLALPSDLEGLDWSFGPIPFSKVATVSGMGGRIPFGRLASDVTLGRFALERPIVNLSSAGGRIGERLLAEFVWTFDLAHRRLRLQRRAEGPIRFAPWRGHGAGFLPLEGGGEVVADVIPGSPAEEVGLREGDRVIARQSRPFPGRDDVRSVAPIGADFEGEFVLVDRGGELLAFALPYIELIP